MREDWHAEIIRRKNLYQLCGEILAIRRIDAMKGVEEMLPIIQEETPDTGGASGSGHAIADEEKRRLETTSTTESTTRGAVVPTRPVAIPGVPKVYRSRRAGEVQHLFQNCGHIGNCLDVEETVVCKTCLKQARVVI